MEKYVTPLNTTDQVVPVGIPVWTNETLYLVAVNLAVSVPLAPIVAVVEAHVLFPRTIDVVVEDQLLKA